jgi:hypothetical protein
MCKLTSTFIYSLTPICELYICLYACVCVCVHWNVKDYQRLKKHHIHISMYIIYIFIRCICMRTIVIYLMAIMKPVKDLLRKINKYTEATIVEVFFCSSLSVIDIQWTVVYYGWVTAGWNHLPWISRRKRSVNERDVMKDRKEEKKRT